MDAEIRSKVHLAFSMFEEAGCGIISSQSLRNVFGSAEKFDPLIAEESRLCFSIATAFFDTEKHLCERSISVYRVV